MRLAFVCLDPGIPYGGSKGASVHIAEIVDALAAEGVSVLLLMASAQPMARPPAGVRLELVPGVGKAVSAAARVRCQPDLADWLTDRLGRWHAEVMYERIALHADAAARAASRLGLTHLVELDAPLPEEARRFRTLEEPEAADVLEASTLRSARLVLAVSPPLADYATARGARRVEVLQNAADVGRFPAPRRRADPAQAVFAGTLRPWHGIDTIASAWRLLGRAAPPLLVVGDGPGAQVLDGCGARLTGAVAPADVPELLADAEIGLAPYGTDTPRYFSPIKLFEYMAAGLATVVADLPAVTAVVDEDCAVVIPAGDPLALADAVSGLAADAGVRRRLGDNARERIEAGHTWRHRARRILAVIDSLGRDDDVPLPTTSASGGRAS